MLKVIEHFLRVDVDQTPKTILATHSTKLHPQNRHLENGRLIAKTSSDLTKTNEEGNISLEKNVAVPVCELIWSSGTCASNNYQLSADNGSAGAARLGDQLTFVSTRHILRHLDICRDRHLGCGAARRREYRIKCQDQEESGYRERGGRSSRVTSLLVGQTKDERLWLREVKELYYCQRDYFICYRGWIFYLET